MSTTCGTKPCSFTVTGGMTMGGIACPVSAQVEAAIQGALASTVGISVDDVTVTLPCSSRRHKRLVRRALSLALAFEMSLSTESLASAAVTAIDAAVASGEFGTTMTAQADMRGEQLSVTALVVSMLCPGCVGGLTVVDGDQASNAVFIFVGLPNLLLVIAFVVRWALVLRSRSSKNDIAAVASLGQNVDSGVEPELSDGAEAECGLQQLWCDQQQLPTGPERDEDHPDDRFLEFDNKERVKTAALQCGPALDILVLAAGTVSATDPEKKDKIHQKSDQGTQEESELTRDDDDDPRPRSDPDLDAIDKLLPAVGIVLTFGFLVGWCVLPPLGSYSVMNNVTITSQCIAQNYAQLVTSRCMADLQGTVERSADMLKNGVFFWSSVAAYSNNSASVFSQSLPAVLLGILSSNTDMASLWVRSTGGEVFSAEWISTSSTPVGRMYSPANGLCWQAPYSTSTGYGTWVQTTTGPLGVNCSSVSSAGWYTSAATLTTSVASTESISSGHLGVLYMVPEASTGIVFGGEMDGRTLSAKLQHGKPVEGEIYVVGVSQAGDTLVAATEASAQTQLQSVGLVAPSAVGGLTGSSAKNLESRYGSLFGIWSHSSTVSSADAQGQVAQRCPSDTTAAYIAISGGDNALTGQPTTSVQRYLGEPYQLLVVTSLRGEAYRSNLDAVYVLAVVCGISLCLVAVLLAFIEVPEFAAGVHKYLKLMVWPQHRQLMFYMITVLVLLPSLVWLIVVSSQHSAATYDFAVQTTNSLTSALGTKLDSSTSIARQATNTWQNLGAPTTNLSAIALWSTELLAYYAASSNLTSLRFGTATGLEESVNSTAGGLRVLRRSNYTDACLQTFLTDGATYDGSNNGDNCFYDPRYTDWYEAGRSMSGNVGFSNTYNNTWIAALSKACPGQNCSSGLSGIWASEWSTESLSATLSSLKDGFEGSLAIVENTGVILAASSGVRFEAVATTTDAYLKRASHLNWTGVTTTTDTAIHYTQLGYAAMDWAAYPDANGKFLALMSLERLQFHRTYDETRSRAVALILVGLILISLAVELGTRKKHLRFVSTKHFDRRVYKRFQQFYEGPDEYYVRLQAQLQALRQHLDRNPTSHLALSRLAAHANSAAVDLENGESPVGIKQTTLRLSELRGTAQITTCEALDVVGQMLLLDLAHGIDAELHIFLLMSSARVQSHLIPLLRLVSQQWYMIAVNTALSSLLALGWLGWPVLPLQIVLALGLLADAALVCALGSQRVRSFEYTPEGETELRAIPRMYDLRTVTVWVYGALLLVVLILFALMGDAADSVADYAYPLILILRNEAIWSECIVFVYALAGARRVAYLWLRVLIVVAGMATVLLHGQFDTGDYYVDMEFYDFYHSITTVSIYLLSFDNFERVVQPSLLVHGLYVIIWVVVALFGVFFITAILLQIFSESYSKRTDVPASQGARRSTWVALASVFALSVPDTQTPNQGMGPLEFEQLLMLSDSTIGWTDGVCEKLVCEIMSLLTQHSSLAQQCGPEIAALATLCCEFNYEAAYQTIVQHGWVAGERCVPQTCTQARSDIALPGALVRYGICGDDEEAQITHIGGMLGNCDDEQARVVLYNTNVPLAVTTPNEVVAIAIACSFDLHCGRLYTKDTADWVEIIAKRVFCLESNPSDTSSENPERSDMPVEQLRALVLQLIKLSQLHKWRIRELFNALRSEKVGPDVMPAQFDRMWCIAKVCSVIGRCRLLQSEAHVMLLEQEFDVLEAKLNDTRLGDAGRGVIQHQMLDCRRTCTDSQVEINRQLGGSFSNYDARSAVLQLLALVNLGAVAFFGNPTASKVALDIVLVAFSVGFAVEFILWVRQNGVEKTMFDDRHVDMHVATRISVLAMCISLLGSLFLVLDQQGRGMPVQDARTLASFTVLLVITWNRKFGQIFLAFSRATATCMPIMLAIFCFIAMFALASKDVFPGTIVNPETKLPYFDTFGNSLATCFRFFTTHWHRVLNEIVINTTEAAQLWFTLYMVVVTVFGCSLLVGVVMAYVMEVQTIPSSRLYAVLESAFAFGTKDRGEIIAAILKLNCTLKPFNDLFQEIAHPPTPDLEQNDLHHYSSDESSPRSRTEIDEVKDDDELPHPVSRNYDDY
eukprot:TRINITY_DN6198_c0_g4_i1.p1 TRINITY_DN6198_c0_g4~~TRINITY_DN6198_c0_g4_i1.p1  ORF type:complete len:2110 (-),score=325.82 TRINITY_DN6198_c0_g4_i1:69-6398(-)